MKQRVFRNQQNKELIYRKEKKIGKPLATRTKNKKEKSEEQSSKGKDYNGHNRSTKDHKRSTTINQNI